MGIHRSTLRGKMEKYNIKKEVLVSEEESWEFRVMSLELWIMSWELKYFGFELYTLHFTLHTLRF
jgi:hypothetical protein